MQSALRTMLDPRGVRILKRKLLAGEITPQVFKEVLKRQMIKQYLRSRPGHFERSLTAIKIMTVGRWQPLVDPESEESGPFSPGPLDMEELFAMARVRRN